MYKRQVIENNSGVFLSFTGDEDYSTSLNRSDELALYSSDCSAIRSACVPSSYQESAPAIVPAKKQKTDM